MSSWRTVTRFCHELHSPESGACVYCSPQTFTDLSRGHEYEEARLRKLGISYILRLTMLSAERAKEPA